MRLGEHRIDMESPMHRSGDCGACHRDPKSPAAAGHVFLTDDAVAAAASPVARCAESP